MNILHIKKFDSNVANGGQAITSRNEKILMDCGSYFSIKIPSVNFKFNALLSMVKLEGFYNSYILEASKQLRVSIDLIFIDSSIYAGSILGLKSTFPNSKVVVFFHNIESKYYADKAKFNAPHYYIFSHYIKIIENKAFKYADVSFFMTSRDEQFAKNKLGSIKSAIIPSSLPNTDVSHSPVKDPDGYKLKALFVGSSFYANVEGINWFVNEILKNNSFKELSLTIVGTGMDSALGHLNERDNIFVKGFVEDLKEEYANSDLVISPIISGSGMKTKTTEALLYSKHIVGTPEAFVGFELDYQKIGGVFTSQIEFKVAIDNVYKLLEKHGKNNKYSRTCFEEKYTDEAIAEQFRNEFEKLI